MKIVFLTTANQQTASSRTRVFQYIPYINNQNIQTRIFVRNPYFLIRPKNILFRIAQRLQILFNEYAFFFYALFSKTIFLQKVYLPKFMISCFVALKKKMIYDFDDAIYITEKNTDIKAKKLNRLKYTLKNASLIIVENEANKTFSNQFNNNVLIITGPIECNRYRPAPEKTSTNSNSSNEPIVIGWIGSSGTTMYLDVVKKALQILSEKHPQIKLLLIGASEINIPGVTIISEPWQLETEVSLLEKLDIGIMPLFNDEWSSGKGGYKLLQYMAMGIASVATKCGINDEIITHGENGYLASNEQEWILFLEELIIDKEKRILFGKNARTTVCQNYSYEHYTPIIINALG